MAGIDKTYIDGKEYPTYRQWWVDHYAQMKRELNHTIWLYPFTFLKQDGDITPEYLKTHTADLDYMVGVCDFPIWNTSERIDKWLIKNCDISSFRERMLEVYNHKWSGFKGQKWVPKKNFKPKYKR